MTARNPAADQRLIIRDQHPDHPRSPASAGLHPGHPASTLDWPTVSASDGSAADSAHSWAAESGAARSSAHTRNPPPATRPGFEHRPDRRPCSLPHASPAIPKAHRTPVDRGRRPVPEFTISSASETGRYLDRQAEFAALQHVSGHSSGPPGRAGRRPGRTGGDKPSAAGPRPSPGNIPAGRARTSRRSISAGDRTLGTGFGGLGACLLPQYTQHSPELVEHLPGGGPRMVERRRGGIRSEVRRCCATPVCTF